jgi:hypothetical protein
MTKNSVESRWNLFTALILISSLQLIIIRLFRVIQVIVSITEHLVSVIQIIDSIGSVIDSIIIHVIHINSCGIIIIQIWLFDLHGLLILNLIILESLISKHDISIRRFILNNTV